MRRGFHLFSALFLASGLACAPNALAETFSFTVTPGSGIGAEGSGTLTAIPDPTIPMAFDVTGITGSIDGSAITGLLPCATYSLSHPCTQSGLTFDYDNLLYPDGLPPTPFNVVKLDDAGLGIALAVGGLIEISATGSHQYTLTPDNQPQDATPIHVGFDVSPVPEPSSFLLLGTGLAAAATAIRGRSRSR